MIEFRIGNQALELPDNFVFSHTRKSPLYLGGTMDVIPGGYSLPATISARSPMNQRLLGYPDMLNNWNSFSNTQAISVYIGGNLYQKGKLHTKLASPDLYQVQFFSSAGDLADLNKKTLQDYELGGEFTIDGTTPQDFQFNYIIHEALAQTEPGYDHVIYYSYPFTERFEIYSALTTLSLYVKDILQYIFEEEGYTLQSSVFDDPELAKLILYHARWFYDGTNINQTSLTIRKNNHVPKLQVTNFLKSLAKLFCLGYDIDSRQRIVRLFRHTDLLDNTSEIDWSDRVSGSAQKKQKNYSVKSLQYKIEDPMADKHEEGQKLFNYNILDSVSTIADLPAGNVGDVRYIYREAAYARYLEDGWDTDHLFQSLAPIAVGTTGAKIESNLSTLYTLTAIDSGNLYPTTDKPVTYASNSEAPTDQTGQLLFYRGQINNANNSAYGMASSENHNYDGSTLGSYTLKWYGEAGLFTQHWKPWTDFLSSAYEVEISITPQYIDLFALDFTKKIVMWDEHSGSHQRYFLKQFKVVVDMRGIRSAKQTFIPIRP